MDRRGERLPWRDELAQALFGLWAVTGLYLDGWAHRHDKPETFFSPWHGVLYSGATAGILYAWWRRRHSPMFVHAGQRTTLVGLVLFVAGAVGDGVWHEVFGIETNIEALLSPTHLLLMTGGILALTGPVRSAWHGGAPTAPSFRDFFPASLSLALGVAAASFFWMYVSPFLMDVYGETEPSGASELVDLLHVRGIAGVMVANVLLVGPVLLLLRRWRTPLGTFTLVFAIAATLMSGIEEFWQWPTIGAAVAGGLAADVLIARGARPRTVGWATPAVLWLAFFGLFHVVEGVGWSIELWGGTVVMATLAGLGLSLLAQPPEVPA